MTDTNAPETLLITVDGRPSAWLHDGRLWPYVAGGAGEGDGAGTGDGSDGTEGDETGAGGDTGKGDTGTGKGDEPKTLTMTQAEFDAMLQKRLGQREKQFQKELDDLAARSKMDDAERLKAEKADADKARADAELRALGATLNAELKVASVVGNVDPAKVDRFLKVADIDHADLVDPDGNPDSKAIDKAIKKALAEWPEFAAPTGKNTRSGGEMGAGAGPAKPSNLQEAVAAQLAG